MKKLLFILIIAMSSMAIIAQPPTKAVLNPTRNYQDLKALEMGDSIIKNIPPCFCCDNAYQLPQPVINGTASPACACNTISFSTASCPGANFTWTVKDNFNNNIPFSGNGTPNITLAYSLALQVASQATSITVTLQLRCGQKMVTVSKTITLKPIPPTSINFNLTTDASGNYTATASTIAPGNGNGWTLKEVNCPGPNPCGWVPGPIKWQGVGNTINIPTGVLVKGKCYVLTHYVNVCSPTWISGSCTVYKVTCFSVSGNLMRLKAEDDKDPKPLMLQTEMMQDTNIQK